MSFIGVADAFEKVSGHRPPPGTWRRWVRTGVYPHGQEAGPRVRLKIVKLGGRIYTTEEYAAEFVAATSPSCPDSCSKTSRLAADAKAFLSRELEVDG